MCVKAVERWEQATDLILRREGLLVKLEQFERSASDPNRFFAKDNGQLVSLGEIQLAYWCNLSWPYTYNKCVFCSVR